MELHAIVLIPLFPLELFQQSANQHELHILDKIYVKMRQPEELVSGMLTVDMSNHLPIFTFIGRPTLRKRRHSK